ncbi:hypothetical protein MTO96_037029 [Rhipicephalus appendiculatus]
MSLESGAAPLLDQQACEPAGLFLRYHSEWQWAEPFCTVAIATEGRRNRGTARLVRLPPRVARENRLLFIDIFIGREAVPLIGVGSHGLDNVQPVTV